MTALTVTRMTNSRDKRDQRREQVVARLFDAWFDNDPDRVRSFFREDSVFEPADGERLTGGEAIWSLLAELGSECVERELLDVAAEGDGQVVARRRVRRLVDGRWDERELTAVLAVDGCKICSWQDDRRA